MPSPLIKSFTSLAQAGAARDELVAAGVPAASVQLRVIDDEAGPVEGNFVSGNGRPDTDSPSSSILGAPHAQDLSYEANLADPVYRGSVLLIVESLDDTLRGSAQDIVSRFDAAHADGVR